MRHARTTRTAPSTTTYWSPSIASTPRGRSVGRSSVCLPHVAETGTSRRSWRKVRVAPLDTNPVVVVHDGYNGSATSKATRGTSCPYTLLVSLVHSPGPPVACLRRSTRGHRSPTNIQCLARFASKVLLGFQWSLRPSGLGEEGACRPQISRAQEAAVRFRAGRSVATCPPPSHHRRPSRRRAQGHLLSMEVPNFKSYCPDDHTHTHTQSGVERVRGLSCPEGLSRRPSLRRVEHNKVAFV